MTSDKDESNPTIQSPQRPKGSKIYYSIGTPIAKPKTNPKDEHVRWLLDQFSVMEIPQDEDECDIFQAVLDQMNIYNLKNIDLRDFMLDFIIQQRDMMESVIANNLKARTLTFEGYVNCMAKGKTNGLDLTLKCISMMLRKAIVVLVEDYLWFTHNQPVKQVELAMILRKDGKFTGIRRKDGKLLSCNLPFLKEWMESQTQEVLPEYSSENSDKINDSQDGSEMESENMEVSVEKCSEFSERSENMLSDAQNWSRVDHDHSYDGSKTINCEYVFNVQKIKPLQMLSVRDMDSSDKESLIPSNNSGIGANAHMSTDNSDTTFDSVVDTIIRQEQIGSPGKSVVVENVVENVVQKPDSLGSLEVVSMDRLENISNVEVGENVVENLHSLRSVEVVSMDRLENVSNVEVGENIVDRSEVQKKKCDEQSAFNTAVELFSDTTKSSLNESEGSAVFRSENTDTVNVPTEEATDKGSVDTDKHIVHSEESRALQSTTSSAVNIPDESMNPADNMDVTSDSSLKESDGKSSEYATTDISLQYLTDEGKTLIKVLKNILTYMYVT